ncbi:MAG TPA: hypothetical protein VFG29_00620 [Syntrophales bacterium]|nr:hypothetical protein [Syntrophales bacterium]
MVCGCQRASGVSTTTLKEDRNVSFKRIAVVPFQAVRQEDADIKTVRCPVCGLVFVTENYERGSETIVERIFLDRLKNEKSFVLIPPDRVGGIYEGVTAGLFKADLIEVLKKVGTELEADGIILAYVYRFRERQGFSLSVEKPASVAFEIHLIRVGDGTIVWKGIFDKTQSSLMENLLQIASFLKSGGKWVTAKELAAEGMDDVLKDFPGVRQE